MSNPAAEDQSLPILRYDLRLYRGPDAADGSPTFNLFDPLQGTYFQLGYREWVIVQHFRGGMSARQLLEVLNSQSKLNFEIEELSELFSHFRKNHLLQVSTSGEALLEESELSNTSWFRWLVFHYLFIRIPLFNPNRFLSRTIGYIRPLASRPAWIFYLLITGMGILLTFTHIEEYASSFDYFFNIKGILAYAITLTLVKVVHELSHAYTAKHYKVYVPSIGVALIVLWPVLYTDVTDSWKLYRRRERWNISFAGVAAELVISGLATFAWALTEPGLLKSVLFVTSSTTWISSLAVNLNPAMRFDGYYLLLDLWGIDNLQTRSFAYARWWLRTQVLGLDLSEPEQDLPIKDRRGMIVYALFTWAYRIVLYTTIALIVYYKFTKALGVILFILEILIFLVWPLYSELVELVRLRKYFCWNRRLLLSLALIVAFCLWVSLPFSREIQIPALTVASAEHYLYIPEAAQVSRVHVRQGQVVREEDPILELYSEELDLSIVQVEAEVSLLEAELRMMSISDELRSRQQPLAESLEATRRRLQALKERRSALTIHAQVAGVVDELLDNRLVGQTLKAGQSVGRIVQVPVQYVRAYVPEELMDYLQKNCHVFFQPWPSMNSYSGKLLTIEPTRETHLHYPQLASTYGGDIVVHPATGRRLLITDAYFPAMVELEDGTTLSVGQTGTLTITLRAVSYIKRWWQSAQNILWQESGL